MSHDLRAMQRNISADVFCDERILIKNMLHNINLDFRQKDNIERRAKTFIREIQRSQHFSIEQLLQTYNLSTDEGVAILCLAESLSRIADNETAFELVLDKLSQKDWSMHLRTAQSTFLKFASLGLTLSGKWSDICDSGHFFGGLSSRFSQDMFIGIIRHVIAWLGSNFIVGQTMREALTYIKLAIDKGYYFSFDLLGESARNFMQAEQYYARYLEAVDVIGVAASGNRSISVKLTALYPRFELTKLDDIDDYLIPRLVHLINKMTKHNIAITFDAEESHRLEIYLHVVTRLIMHHECGTANIGIVVQAYQKRASKVIEYIIEVAKHVGKKIPIRLVKGAYWDAEIKYAQTYGLEDYPVCTQKAFTDANYINCARQILDNNQYLHPQFATHNAITASTIIELAQDRYFEFQKLHGMGDVLHKLLKQNHDVRVYAPVGKIEDLLAYLMRRLLENGANTSFVHQVSHYDADNLICNIHEIVESVMHSNSIPRPLNLYQNRVNSIGYDMGYQYVLEEIKTAISAFSNKLYKVGPIIDGKAIVSTKHATERFMPGKCAEKVGETSVATEQDMLKAIQGAKNEFLTWTMTDVSKRAKILCNIADLYHEHRHELYSLLLKEGGKSIHDAIGEVREAIDFCRYYAASAEKLMQESLLPGPTGEKNTMTLYGRGVFLCISPWNFPLAIFTGQIVAALVAGNTVIAKAADQTSIIANFAVQLMHKASIPKNALQLIMASGSQISKYVVTHRDIAGVAFTGSNSTAKLINTILAARDGAIIPIIAETGGQNAMIVDSSALLEQVTDDVLTSAFYSAGQRCSSLRVLYIQEEIYDTLLEMIIGAMAALKIGNTLDFSNDIGPVIDRAAYDMLTAHIQDMQSKGFNVKAVHPQKDSADQDGYYFYPHILEISHINDISEEKFGPILHVIKYKNTEIDKVIDEINDYGYGLTFGVHSRIERRIEHIRSRIKVGNIYANRSITGAQVESQPFGGENKSGTGFKAGGPHYLLKFVVERVTSVNLSAIGGNIELLK